MFGSRRINARSLEQLSRRLSLSILSGVDIRKSLAREATNARWPNKSRLENISQAVNGGTSLAEALKAEGDFFPELFRQLVDVGEKTGHLGEILRQLADHYDHQISMRQQFMASLRMPLLQFIAAIVAVGFLAMASASISKSLGTSVDMVGLGFTGESGVIRLGIFVAIFVAVIFFLWRSFTRGAAWMRKGEILVMRSPKLGTSLQTLAIARLSWILKLGMDAGLDLKRTLELAFASTQLRFYTNHTADVWKSIRRGSSLHEALKGTEIFPHEFLAAVEVGEHSGRLSETMVTLSERYQEEGRAALRMLIQLAGIAVWCVTAAMVAWIVISFFASYANMIQSLSTGR